jgi:hypothetical protein
VLLKVRSAVVALMSERVVLRGKTKVSIIVDPLGMLRKAYPQRDEQTWLSTIEK